MVRTQFQHLRDTGRQVCEHPQQAHLPSVREEQRQTETRHPTGGNHCAERKKEILH